MNVLRNDEKNVAIDIKETIFYRRNSFYLFFFLSFSFTEPIKKRSKLVLPCPQISDAELEDVSWLWFFRQNNKYMLLSKLIIEAISIIGFDSSICTYYWCNCLGNNYGENNCSTLLPSMKRLKTDKRAKTEMINFCC